MGHYTCTCILYIRNNVASVKAWGVGGRNGGRGEQSTGRVAGGRRGRNRREWWGRGPPLVPIHFESHTMNNKQLCRIYHRHKSLDSQKTYQRKPDIFQNKPKEHNKQLHRTNQTGKISQQAPKRHPKRTNKNMKKKHVETYEFYHRKWAALDWDSRSGRATRTMAAYLHEKNRAQIQNSE